MVPTAPYEKIFIGNIQTIMKLKKGFVLREVCGERVIMGEGLGAINFGKLLTLNETAAWLWQQAQNMGDFTIEALAERLCALRTWRDIYYSYNSVTCLFDIAMLEKYLGQKKFSQRRKDIKDIKEYEAYKKTDYSVSRK